MFNNSNHRYRFLLAPVLFALILLVQSLRLQPSQLQGDELISMDVCSGFGFDSVQRHYSVTPLAQNPFWTNDYWQRFTTQNVIAHTIKDNGNGLLYNLALHYWISQFSFSLQSARLLSMLSIWLAAILAYYAGRQFWRRRWAASLLALLIAFHPACVTYSFVMRGYALALPFIVLLIGISGRLINSNESLSLRRKWLYFLLLSTVVSILFFINYLTAVISFSCLLTTCFIIYRRQKNWRQFIPLLVSLIIIGGIPVWIWFVKYGGLDALKDVPKMAASLKEGGERYFQHFSFTPQRFFIDILTSFAGLWGFSCEFLLNLKTIISLIVTGLFTCFFIRPSLSAKNNQHILQRAFVAIVLSFFVFSIAAAVKSGTVYSFSYRYWLLITPFALFAIVGAFVHMMEQNRKARIFTGITIALIAARVFIPFGMVAFYNNKLAAANAKYKANETEPLFLVFEEMKKQYAAGDRISYKCWRAAQYANLFFTPSFNVPQQVDTKQPFHFMIKDKNGKVKLAANNMWVKAYLYYNPVE